MIGQINIILLDLKTQQYKDVSTTQSDLLIQCIYHYNFMFDKIQADSKMYLIS